MVWAFGSGPRKSVPLNATWSPRNKSEQRVLNYSAIFDEVEDFENNIRNVSGPNNAPATDQPCAFNAANAVDVSNFRVTHGLMYGDDGDANKTICILNAFAKASAGRREFTVTLPGSTEQIPALTAMKEWVRFKVRTPHGPFLFGKVSGEEPARTRLLGGQIFDERCVSCHNGEKWTTSTKNFTSPTTAFSQETNPPPEAGTNPVATQYLNDFLRNIQSFNLAVPAAGNEIPSFPSIGGIEKAQNGQDALGRDYNGDGKGNGYNVPSLLAINYLPPYYHNGACETLACVLADANHSRIDPGTGSPTLPALSESEVEALVEFVTSIDANTPPKGFRAGRSQPAGTVPLLAPQKAGNRAGAGR